MKKLTTALLAAAALTTAVSAEGSSNTGFYLGASAGVANTNVKYSYVSAGTITGTAVQNFQSNAGKMGGLFGVFAGYGMVVGQGAYVGGELYGGFDTTKMSVYDDSATTGNGFPKTTLKRTNYYGLAARVGYMVTPSTLAYIRLGIEGGKWTGQVIPNQNVTAGYISNASLNTTVSGSKNSISFAPGLGLEAYINKNLFLRAEYSYLFGPTVNISQNVSGYTGGYMAGTLMNYKMKITQHAFKIGVGYKF